MSGKFAPGLDPRCCRPPYKGKIPETLNATGLLKPCCYYSTTREWGNMCEWAEKHGLDPNVDMNVMATSIDEVKSSPTWTKLKQGMETGDVPKTCYEKCSDDQEAKGTKEANNWKRVAG